MLTPRQFRVLWAKVRSGCPDHHLTDIRIAGRQFPATTVSGMTAASLIREGSTIAGFRAAQCATCHLDMLVPLSAREA
jgi:hypothetical protein